MVEEETTEEEDEAALGQGGEEQMEVKVGRYVAALSWGVASEPH